MFLYHSQLGAKAENVGSFIFLENLSSFNFPFHKKGEMFIKMCFIVNFQKYEYIYGERSKENGGK